MKRIIFLSLFVWLTQGIMAQGHKIEVTIKGMSDSTIILGYYNGDKLSVQDSIKLNKKGVGVVQGEKPLPRGKYFIFLDEYKRFDLMIGNEQKFSLVADTTDLVNKTEVKGSKENELFYGYIRYIQDKIKLRGELEAKIKEEKDEKKKQKLKEQMAGLMNQVRDYMDKLIADNPTSFFAKQLKSTFQVEIPEELRKKDRKVQFEYYKAHYFDNIDFSEAGLSRTKEFPEMVDTYLQKMVYQVPDSIYPEIDMLVSKSTKNDDMFKFMIMHLHDFYVTSENLEMENVYVWFFDKYFLPKANWIDREFMNKRKEHVSKLKPLLIGKAAPELTMEIYEKELHDIFSNLIRLSQEGDEAKKKIDEKKDTAKWLKRQTEITDSLTILNEQVKGNSKRKFQKLYDVKAKYTVLAFWEPECSHCKKAIPDLHTKYTEKLKAQGIEVFAACTQLKPNIWGEFLDKHKLYNWINAWDPYNNSNFRDKYEIHSTPSIFILDENKNILLKKVSVEHIEEAIKYLNDRYAKK